MARVSPPALVPVDAAAAAGLGGLAEPAGLARLVPVVQLRNTQVLKRPACTTLQYSSDTVSMR